jgi:hypothetical protein
MLSCVAAAAHNCTMRAVALLGTHKAFDLKNADLTCANMRELTVYNIRCELVYLLYVCCRPGGV